MSLCENSMQFNKTLDLLALLAYLLHPITHFVAEFLLLWGSIIRFRPLDLLRRLMLIWLLSWSHRSIIMHFIDINCLRIAARIICRGQLLHVMWVLAWQDQVCVPTPHRLTRAVTSRLLLLNRLRTFLTFVLPISTWPFFRKEGAIIVMVDNCTYGLMFSILMNFFLLRWTTYCKTLGEVFCNMLHEWAFILWWPINWVSLLNFLLIFMSLNRFECIAELDG